MFGILSAITISLTLGGVALWSFIISFVILIGLIAILIITDRRGDLDSGIIIVYFLIPLVGLFALISGISGIIWIIALLL